MSLRRSSIQDTAVRPPVTTTRHDPQSARATAPPTTTGFALTAAAGLLWWWATHRNALQCAADCAYSEHAAAG